MGLVDKETFALSRTQDEEYVVVLHGVSAVSKEPEEAGVMSSKLMSSVDPKSAVNRQSKCSLDFASSSLSATFIVSPNFFRAS